jgi:two-component system KDP operon response regulator KdpE
MNQIHPVLPFTADILIIGGVEHTVRLVHDYVEVGAVIRTAFSAGEGFRLLMERMPSLVIIDANLSNDCTFSLTTYIRHVSTVGIVQIGASHELASRIFALESGADYYITTPIHEAEFRAVLKNAYRHIAMSKKDLPNLSQNWSCCRLDRTLYAPNGRYLTITPKELRLLEVIAAHPVKTVIERYAFAAELNRLNSQGFDKLFNVSVGRLRKKIVDACAIDFPLNTIRSAGIRFDGELLLLPLTRPASLLNITNE